MLLIIEKHKKIAFDDCTIINENTDGYLVEYGNAIFNVFHTDILKNGNLKKRAVNRANQSESIFDMFEGEHAQFWSPKGSANVCRFYFADDSYIHVMVKNFADNVVYAKGDIAKTKLSIAQEIYGCM